MSKKWRQRLGIGAAVVGGVALGVAGKDQLKGFASSAGSTLGGLLGQLTKGRPLADFIPDNATIREGLEDIIKKTPAGQAAVQEGIAQRLGAFLTSPMGMVTALVAVVGLIWIARR
jgi:hypothetical protein